MALFDESFEPYEPDYISIKAKLVRSNGHEGSVSISPAGALLQRASMLLAYGTPTMGSTLVGVQGQADSSASCGRVDTGLSHQAWRPRERQAVLPPLLFRSGSRSRARPAGPRAAWKPINMI